MKAKIVLLTLSVYFLMLSTGANAKVYLVSVGIADYPGSDMDLTLPTRDAQTIAWLYSKNTNVEYCLLLDDKATKRNIESAMYQFFAKATADDIIVFFYSGHGFPGGFAVYDGSLTYTQIRKAMKTSKCKSKMIFADACFSGKIRTDGRLSHNSVLAAKKANVMLFLSSRSDETSIERTDMQNGFFTTYLQQGLRGGADKNKDRIITAYELYEYVHKGVIEISNGKQHPVMWGNFSNDMPVMKWGK